jgi:tetraacyldisaccharide 4'-kinase
MNMNMSVPNLIINPLSYFYGQITSIRNTLFDQNIIKQYHAPVSVISVGNLTVGGTGKTPFIIYLCNTLTQQGYKVGIISRGYGGSATKPTFVDSDTLSNVVGDEPKLLSETLHVPIVVSPKRSDGVKLLLQYHPEINVILLDDGLQHRYIHRDLNFITVDVSTSEAIDNFLKGKLLPAGFFREDRDKGLQRASAIILSHRKVISNIQSIPDDLVAILPKKIPFFETALTPPILKRLDGTLIKKEEIKNEVAILCGIANPNGFIQTVKSTGLKISHQFLAKDHARYSLSDLTQYADKLPNNALIITTAKDAIKINEIIPLNHHLRECFIVVTVQTTLIADENHFLSLLDGGLNKSLLTT